MKFNIEVDISPEEVRRLMGLPDLAPVQDRYVARLAEMTEGGITPEAVEALVRNWGPLGETGMGLWRAMIDAGNRKDRS